MSTTRNNLKMDQKIDELHSLLQLMRNEMNNGFQEVKDLKEENQKLKNEITILQNENVSIRDQMDKLVSTIECQQSFLEHLDTKERENNIIIFGLEEKEPLDQCNTDEAKVELLLKSLDQENFCQLVFTCKRLGESKEGQSSRPLLVILPSGDIRKAVLAKTKILVQHRLFRNIKIKKDQSPAIRREWGRLFRVEKEEMKKPENAGHQINFDKKKRQILRDGVVIDRFMLTSVFQQAGRD